MKFFFGLALITNIVADDTPLIGGPQGDHGCVIGAGYTWCKSSNNCIRSWITPCDDNYSDCSDCLEKQRSGMNIACPEQCDHIIIDPLPPVYYPTDPLPPVYYPTDPLPPVYYPLPPQHVCPDVMCMMYCPNGHQIDANGCQMCQCNNDLPTPLPPTPQPPTPQPPAPQPPVAVDECTLAQPSCAGHSYVCPKLTEITNCNEGGIDGHTTYQLSLLVKPNMNIKNIYALFGDTDTTMRIPPAYQSHSNHGQNIGGVNAYIASMFPDSNYDSWLTIGLIDGNPENKLSAVGIDFNDWSESGAIDVTDGAVFTMDPVDVDLTTMGTDIIIGQLTIPTHSTHTVIVNVQGKSISSVKSHAPTEPWTERNIQFPLISPRNANIIPYDCESWYDGCNTCSANNGVLGACTRLMCFREDSPYCLRYTTSGH